MSIARDAGLAALQSGDIQTAITQLEEAVREDPSDYDACLYLGGAYGQAGRHLDAVKSFTQAVQLQPANAQARYNLGVAMEQGGYAEQAAQVYAQAVHLQPDYPNAQEALTRLHAASNQGFGGPVTSSSSTTGYGQQLQQPQTQADPQQTQQFAQPAAFGQQPSVQSAGYNPLAPTPEPAQPTVYSPLAQTQPISQAPAFGQPAPQPPVQPGEPGLGSYMAPPPAAVRPVYGQSGPGASGGYGGRPGAMPYSSGPSYDDEFRIGQSFKDFGRALFMPRTLFQEMAGCDTSSSTMALFIVYCFIYFLVGMVSIVKLMSGPLGPVVAVGGIIGVAIGCFSIFVTWAIVAGVVHMLSRAFGSSLNYGASFRCVVYSAAPFMLLSGIGRVMIDPSMPNMAAGRRMPAVSSVIVTPVQYSGGPGARQFGGAGTRPGNPMGGAGGGQPNSYGSPNGAYTSTPSSPFANGMPNPFEKNPLPIVLILVGALWSIGLLGVAVTNVHQVSGGAGAGVAILTAIITTALFIGLCIIFAMVFGLAFASLANKVGGS